MLPRAATVADAERSPRRALATVFAIVVIDLLGFGIVIPILPFYVRSFGVSDVFIGLLAASYSVMQFGFAPLLGRISDERGRRPVLMLSMGGSAIAWVVFGLGAEFQTLFGLVGGLAAIFGARMLAGAMGGNIAAAQAYVADVTPPERRAGALGLVGAAFGLGFVFGPALGALFASDPVVTAADSALPSYIPTTRFSLPSFAAAGFSLLAFVATYLVLPEPDRVRSKSAARGIVAQFRAALADADLRPLVVVFLVVSIAFSGIQVAFIPFVADEFGYTTSQAGVLLTFIGALGVFNQGVFVPGLSRRVTDSRLALAGTVFLVVAVAIFPFTGTLGQFLPPLSLFALGQPGFALLGVLALLSLGNSLLNIGAASMVSRAAGEDQQGSAFGVTQGAGSLGRTIGPPVMTALYVVAVAAPFLMGAVLYIGVVVLLLSVMRSAVDGTTAE